MPSTRTVTLEGNHGQHRRLVITDRGSYQHVALYDGNGLIGEFGYSANDAGVYDCWTLRGEGMTMRQLRTLGLS